MSRPQPGFRTAAKRIVSVIVAVAVVGSSGLVGAGPAAAEPGRSAPDPAAAVGPAVTGTPTWFHNWHSDLCLGILPNDNTYGKQGDAVQWDCTDHSDQLWYSAGTDCIVSGFCQLINAVKPPQCLSVRGASVKDKTRLAAGPCGGRTHRDQYWKLGFDAEDGLPTITNYNSGKLAVVDGDSMFAGAAVIQYPRNKSDGQRWWRSE